jgi:hypothetical protein
MVVQLLLHLLYKRGLCAVLHANYFPLRKLSGYPRPRIHIFNNAGNWYIRVALHKAMNDFGEVLEIRVVTHQVLHVAWYLRQNVIVNSTLVSVSKSKYTQPVVGSNLKYKIQARTLIKEVG